MATDNDPPAPDGAAVRVAALEGTIAALEAKLVDADGDERRALERELAARNRELTRLREE